MKKKLPTLAIPPISNAYLTKGKEYKIIDIEDGSKYKCRYIFNIVNELNTNSFCLSEGCAHIERKKWKLI